MSEIIIAIVSGFFLVGAALVAFFGTRGKTRADAKAALDARIDAMVSAQLTRDESRISALESRIEELEQSDSRKMAAVARILRAIAAQWPTEVGPDLELADLAEIEETIPARWFRRPIY